MFTDMEFQVNWFSNTGDEQGKKIIVREWTEFRISKNSQRGPHSWITAGRSTVQWTGNIIQHCDIVRGNRSKLPGKITNPSTGSVHGQTGKEKNATLCKEMQETVACLYSKWRWNSRVFLKLWFLSCFNPICFCLWFLFWFGSAPCSVSSPVTFVTPPNQGVHHSFPL